MGRFGQRPELSQATGMALGTLHPGQVLRGSLPLISPGTYVYSQKHNSIPYSTFNIHKVQLHVSAINVGRLQVVHEALNDK